eukprot:1182877-Prorocentrum_minimum.AAC.1
MWQEEESAGESNSRRDVTFVVFITRTKAGMKKGWLVLCVPDGPLDAISRTRSMAVFGPCDITRASLLGS